MMILVLLNGILHISKVSFVLASIMGRLAETDLGWLRREHETSITTLMTHDGMCMAL